LVDLPRGQILYDSGHPQEYAYFPTTATVALRYPLEGGRRVNLAVIGNEGVVGIPLFFAAQAARGTAVVQHPGQALRLDARAVADETQRGGPLLHAVLRYTQSLMVLLMQTAACNRYHSVQQQLCRWLLLNLDRLKVDVVAASQESIAEELGVRRVSVTQVAARLRTEGLIRTGRGRIELVDRLAMEQRACECYARERSALQRLRSLPGL